MGSTPINPHQNQHGLILASRKVSGHNIQRDDHMADTNEFVPSESTIKERLEKAAKLDAKIMTGIRAAFDTSDKLKRQTTLGESFVERARHQKECTTDWNKAAYSDLASRREEQAKIELGINDVRLDVSAKIYGFVEAAKITNPLVEKVSYYRIANHFIPMFEWDVKTLEGQIKPEWLTFVRNIIDRNAETEDSKPMPIKELVAAIDEEKKTQAQTANLAPNDNAGKALKGSAKAAATREKNAAKARRDAAREGLQTAVEAIVEHGDMSKADLTKHFLATASEFDVEIPIERIETVKPFDAKSATVASVKELMQALYLAGKMAEIDTIVRVGGTMLTTMLEEIKTAA